MQLVIPLLSGHIGGANALAEKLAEKLDATAVVTTATDVRGKFAVDAWAARHGCAISDMGLAKAVSAAILEHDLPLCSEFPVCPPLPGGVVCRGGDRPSGHFHRLACQNTLCPHPAADPPRVAGRPRLPPRGISAEAVVRAVRQVFAENGLALAAISGVSSIDLKQDEPGLLAACRATAGRPGFNSAAQLRGMCG